MMEYFESLRTLDKVFMVCAAMGGILFVFRLVLFLIGSHHHGDVDHPGDIHMDDPGGLDMDEPADLDMDDVDVVHDSDASFRLLSLQSITAFFMIFGLVGLALSKQNNLAAPFAVIGALAGGIGAMWLIGKLFKSLSRLQSDGTMNVHHAVGEEGTVYLTIPADGEGKVQVTVQETMRELTAVSKYKKEIKTGEKVVVDSVTDAGILVVRPIPTS
ncbi:MAG: hypothetical protein GY765_30360 [bacterium]|nr:hypothetical protein [bacterium]